MQAHENASQAANSADFMLRYPIFSHDVNFNQSQNATNRWLPPIAAPFRGQWEKNRPCESIVLVNLRILQTNTSEKMQQEAIYIHPCVKLVK